MNNISTPQLVAYCSIVENIILSTSGLLNSCDELMANGAVKREQIEKNIVETQLANNEARAKYILLQKELDKRIKKDLNLNFGIRRTQTIIERFDETIHKLQLQSQGVFQHELEKAKKDLKIVPDDNPEQ